jgi:hypothetical protein
MRNYDSFKLSSDPEYGDPPVEQDTPDRVDEILEDCRIMHGFRPGDYAQLCVGAAACVGLDRVELALLKSIFAASARKMGRAA